MPTIKFYIRSQTKEATIYARLSIEKGHVLQSRTNLMVNHKDWDAKKEAPIKTTVENPQLLYHLNELRDKIRDAYNLASDNRDMMDKHWFAEVLRGEESEISKVVDAAQHLIDNAHTIRNQKNGKGLSKGRIKIYKVFKNKILEYNPRLRIGSVSQKEAEKFEKWLKDKGYSNDYTASFLSRLKTVCRYAEKQGATLNKSLGGIGVYYEPRQPEAILILTDKEQQKIAELNLTDGLKNSRQWLLIGCQMGQRGGDLLEIDFSTIRKVRGKEVIDVYQKKGGKWVAVPIVPKCRNLLDDFVPEKISLIQFNKDIKILARRAGLKELVKGRVRNGHGKPYLSGEFPKFKLLASHVCRRSFASNYYGVVPTPFLMAITSHSKESTFLSYIGLTSEDKAMQIFNYL